MKIVKVIIVVLGFLPFTASALTCLSFTTADDQSHGRAKAMNAVLTECLNRMGIGLVVVPMPSKRSLMNADAGVEDGNFLRTKGITQAYPNLIRVPERISENRIMAFSKDRTIRINGWKSLLGFHVAYVNGWRNCERELKSSRKKTVVKNETLLFTLLKKDRADLGVFGHSTGMEIIRKLGYTDIKALEPPIVVSDLFLYLNRKHRELIPEIVKTLRSMKTDGTYERLVNKYQAY